METPWGVVKSMAGHIDQLQAEETLTQLNLTKAGTGNMSKGDYQAYVRRLEKLRDSSKRKRPGTRASLATLGIPVKVVRKNERESGPLGPGTGHG